MYAEATAFPQHGKAHAWWAAALQGSAEIGLASAAIFGFLRLTTSRHVLSPPLPMGDALGRVDEWLGRSHVRFLLPGPRHLSIAWQLLGHSGTARDLTTDAQLAALAIEHNAEVHSADADFARFPGLRWLNPLA